MGNKFHIYKIYLLFILMALVGCTVHGCAEAQFELSPESRLPVWFSLPSGVSRQDVTVTLDSYADSTERFTLKNKDGKILSVVWAEARLHPETEKIPKNKWGGYDNSPYPRYVVSTHKGISEITEHKKMEPIFYISDDPQLRNQLRGR